MLWTFTKHVPQMSHSARILTRGGLKTAAVKQLDMFRSENVLGYIDAAPSNTFKTARCCFHLWGGGSPRPWKTTAAEERLAAAFFSGSSYKSAYGQVALEIMPLCSTKASPMFASRPCCELGRRRKEARGSKGAGGTEEVGNPIADEET